MTDHSPEDLELWRKAYNEALAREVRRLPFAEMIFNEWTLNLDR